MQKKTDHKMEVYEYYGKVSKNGQLTLPDDLKKKLSPHKKLRIMIFLEKEDLDWQKTTPTKFFQGYCEKDKIYDDL